MTTKNFVVKNGITTGNIVLDATSGNITGVGNANLGNLVTANFFSGNGSLLTGVGATTATTAGTVTTNAQPNITSVGTLTSLSTSGNANIGNIGTAGLITATGNINGGNIITAGVVSATGNVTGGNLTTGGLLSVTGNANVGNLGTTGVFAITLSATGIANVGNLGTTGLITATGNITGGNIITGGLITATGNLNAGNIVTAGVVSATGNLTAGNVTTAGLLSATGGATFGANVAMTSKNITGLADPVGAQDAATKNYVDTTAQGLDAKASVNYATAAGLPAYTYNNGTSGVGATLTGNANGALSVDGSAVIVGQRILVKNETSTNAPYNGIYVVTAAGSAGAAYVLTRATDFDVWSEIPSAFTFVESGSSNADTGWVCIADAGGTIGTTAITFTQFSGAGSYTAGTGLTLTGSVFSINTAQPTITSVGTLTALSVSGNANVGNLGTSGLITATGNIGGGNLVTTGLVSAGSLTVTGVSNLGAVGNVTITGGSANYLLQTNGSGALTWVAPPSTATIANGTSNVNIPASGGNVNTSVGGTANVLIVTATGANISGTLSASGNANVGNVGATGVYATTLSATANANVGNIGTAGLITATGNLNAGNIITAGIVSATGNGTFGNVTATLHVGNLSGTGNSNVGNLGISGLITVTGNANIGNIGTAGIITATGNIGGGNINTAGIVSATGNVAGGNLTTAGAISATGNANVGNIGATGGVFTTIGGSLTTAAQPNITSTGTLISLSVTGNANVGNINATSVSTTRANVTVTTNTVIDQFAPATFRTAKYTISASNDNGYESAEVLLVQDGTSSYVTIYGTISSNASIDIIDISSNINGVSGNVSLYASSTSGAGNCKVNIMATYIKI